MTLGSSLRAAGRSAPYLAPFEDDGSNGEFQSPESMEGLGYTGEHGGSYNDVANLRRMLNISRNEASAAKAKVAQLTKELADAKAA